MHRFLIASIFCLFCHNLSLSQVDSAYVESFPNTFLVSPFFSNRNLLLEFYPKDGTQDFKDSNEVEYRPNVRRVNGLRFFYKNIGFSLAFQAPNSLNDVNKYGETDYLDLGFQYAKRNIVVDFYYKDYRGFADFTTQKYYPQKDGYTLRGDIHLDYWKVKGMYLFNGNKYSYKSAFNFVERQRKSVSSWLLISHIHRLRLSADSAFIPQPIQSNYGEFGKLNEHYVTGLGLGGGFTRNIALGKKFTLSPLVALGFDVQHQTFHTTEENSRISISPLFDLRFSVGYNSDKFFAGITLTDDWTSVHFPKLVAVHQYIRFDFMVGFRLPPPKIFKKIEKKLSK